MNMLSFLPDTFWHSLVFLGMVGIALSFVLTFIPFIRKYNVAIQTICIIVLVIGVFMEGVIANDNKWTAKVKELEVKLAQAETQSVKETVKIVDRVRYKTEIIKVRGEEIIQYVDREIVKYDNRCEIPKEFVNAHNKAAEGVK